MEDYQKERILTNLNYLIQGTNDFERVFEGLKKKGLFNIFMENEIMKSYNEPERRLGFLYQYVTTRGPKAFSQLCEVLRETGNTTLAKFLSGERCFREAYVGNGSSYQPTLEEEYPDDREWIVTKAIERMDINREKVYKMGSRIKGLALIINIGKFVNNIADEREGSECDIRRLKSILSQLDYKVTVYEDLSAEDIEKEVKAFANREDHQWCDSAVVFVMSHGRDDFNSRESETINIVGFDSAIINSQTIVKQLMAFKCKALSGKPKLFFFQACRGNKRNYPVLTGSQSQKDYSPQVYNVQTDGQPYPQAEYHRGDSDIIIGYSTSPGYVSLRDPYHGSWYIQTLCRVIAKYAWKEDLATLLEYVDRTLATMGSGCGQTSTNSSNLHKKFYFQPGIYDCPQN